VLEEVKEQGREKEKNKEKDKETRLFSIGGEKNKYDACVFGQFRP